MQAGLVAGFVALGMDPSHVIGHTVYAKTGQARSATLERADRTVKLIDPKLRVDDSSISIDDGQLGEEYGIPTDSMRAAVRLLASTEGLLLDPVYSGKAFAGLLQQASLGNYRKGQNILFVMTGGLPGLFAYRREF